MLEKKYAVNPAPIAFDWAWCPIEGGAPIMYADNTAYYRQTIGNVTETIVGTAEEVTRWYFGTCTAPVERPFIKIGGWRSLKTSTLNDAYYESCISGLNARDAFYAFVEAGLIK